MPDGTTSQDAGAADTLEVSTGGTGQPQLFNAAIPLEVAVSSPDAPSTVSIECQEVDDDANGGTLTRRMIFGTITAVQTTPNS